MALPDDLDQPWLVAAWPGMGAVALGAMAHLQDQLQPEKVTDLPADGFFDIAQVPVKDGILQPAKWPESTIHGWKNPDPNGRDLLLFLGEAQPAARGYEFCGRVLDVIAQYGVSRVFTFAAMATPNHPRNDARVFGVATAPHILAELATQNVELLGEAEISGLNGVFLAVAAKRGLEGICLLGEFPYFATGIANPKASAAVLRVFSQIAELDVDLTELDREGKKLEGRLSTILERLQQSGQAPFLPSPDDMGFEVGDELPEVAGGEPEAPGPSRADRARVEALFRQAAKDREKALELKRELDRLGAFKEYEDRFLDLFKRGE